MGRHLSDYPPMEDTKSTWLRDQMKARNLTHQQLADALNRVRVQATAIINGQQALKLDQLAPTAQLLGISVCDLLAGLDIDPGRPAIDKDLLSDCLAAVLQRHGIAPSVADQMAHMASTLYNRAASDARFRAPDTMSVSADLLAEFAAARK